MSLFQVANSFQRGIEALSQRSSKNHVYPRPDFIPLNQFLRTKSTASSPGDLQRLAFDDDDLDKFALIYNVATGTSTSFGPSSADIADFLAHHDEPGASILFLRGYASPEWLSAVGDKYEASPRLFRRHLQLKAFTSGGRDLYTSPSLPSSSARVFQFTIPTICSRGVSGSGWAPEDLQADRRLENEAMGRYFKQLRARANVADSIVRRCLLFSKQEYVVEQTISIEVGMRKGRWHAIVWLDSGKDLSQSAPGPWSPRPGTRAWETYFFPVIVQQIGDGTFRSQEDFTFPTRSNTFATLQSSRGNENNSEEWRAAQNVCLLPSQYGSVLDSNIANQDALYGLSELFQFAASAEVQFLNLMVSRIEHELSFVGDENLVPFLPASLLNLKYIKTQLKAHAQSHAETVAILKNRHSLEWPRVELPPDAPNTAERTAVLLLADFEYLLNRAEELAADCDTGMATLANNSQLEESRRSHRTAREVAKLTVIATIFIPLSFVCSVWGMNFAQLGSGTQPLWMWVVTAVPIVSLSLLVYRWDAVVMLSGSVKNKLSS